MFKRNLTDTPAPAEPFTERELYAKSMDRKTGLETVTCLCKTINIIDALMHIDSCNLDFATHSSAVGKNKKACKCVKSGGVVSIAQHLGECCLGIKPKNWMRTDIGTVGPLVPPSAGQSMQMMTDIGSWPPLTRSYNHLMHAYATAEWRMLAPTRLMSPGAHSVIWHVTTEYMPSIMVRTPQFSLPTMVRQRMTQVRGEVALYGVAAELDSNFLETRDGMIHFMHILEQLAMAGDQCKNLSTAISIVQTARANFHCLGTPDARLPTLEQSSRDLQRGFGIVQRNQPNTWQSLIFWHKDKLRFQRGDYMNNEFSFVMPNQITTHVRVLNKEATSYAWAGPAGPAMYGETSHLGLFSIAGMRVFSMREFTLPQNSFYQPLEAYIEFGEYVPMFDETMDGARYNYSSRDRQVFTHRGFQKVEFGWALENCQLWDEDGAFRDPSQLRPNDCSEGKNWFPWVPSTPTDPDTVLRKPEKFGELKWTDPSNKTEYGVTDAFATNAAMDMLEVVKKRTLSPWTIANLNDFLRPLIAENYEAKDDSGNTLASGTVLLVGHCKAAYLQIPCNKSCMVNLHRAGVRPPINLILANPHKMARAMDIVGIIPGAIESAEKAGAVWIADNINEKRQIVVKKSFGNIVLRAQDITCTRAALITAYRGGDTVEPLSPENYNPIDFGMKGSMVIIAVPAGWGISAPSTVPEVLYLAKDATYLRMDHSVEANFYQKYSYPSAGAYETIYRWIGNQFARPDIRAERQMYGMDPPPINLACRMATHIKRSADGHFTRWVKGNGYWGMDATYYGAENHRYSDNFGKAEYGDYILESCV